MTDKEIYIEVGCAIKSLRKSKNIPIYEASKKLSMSQEKYEAIEEGREIITASDLFFIAHSFESTVYEMLEKTKYV